MANTDSISSYFEILPDEILVEIFLQGIEECKSLSELIEYYASFEMINKKCNNLFKQNGNNILGILREKAKILSLRKDEIVNTFSKFMLDKNHKCIKILCAFEFVKPLHVDDAFKLNNTQSLETVKVFQYSLQIKELPVNESSALADVVQDIIKEKDEDKKENLKKMALQLSKEGFRIDLIPVVSDEIHKNIGLNTNYKDFIFFFKNNFIKNNYLNSILTILTFKLCTHIDSEQLQEKTRIISFLLEQAVSPSLLEKSMRNLVNTIKMNHIGSLYQETPCMAVKMYQNSLKDDHEEISQYEKHFQILLLGMEIAVKTESLDAIIFFSNSYFSQSRTHKETLEYFCKNFKSGSTNKKSLEVMELIVYNYSFILKLQPLLMNNFVNNINANEVLKRIVKSFVNFSEKRLHYLPKKLFSDWQEHLQSVDENLKEYFSKTASNSGAKLIQMLFKEYFEIIPANLENENRMELN